MASIAETAGSSRVAGPHAGLLAIAFTGLFLAGLVPVTLIASDSHFPSPLQSTAEMVAYFRANASRVGICAFLHFSSAIVLGIYAVTMASGLRNLGVRSAAVDIALFGGLAASLMTLVSSIAQWTLAQRGVVVSEGVTPALYFQVFAAGGPGYSVPLGVLMASTSAAALGTTLLPRWVAVLGIALGAIGGLSALALIIPQALFLIPMTRFPGFVWLIAAGFKLGADQPTAPRY